MKKTFPLSIEGKNPDRLLDATKHEIRKYIQRERRKDLPKGADFWDFDCRFGLTADSADVIHIATINEHINQAAQAGSASFYLELLAKPGIRKAKPLDAADDEQTPDA